MNSTSYGVQAVCFALLAFIDSVFFEAQKWEILLTWSLMFNIMFLLSKIYDKRDHFNRLYERTNV